MRELRNLHLYAERACIAIQPITKTKTMKSLADPIRVGQNHNMVITAMLGKHETKQIAPYCDQLNPSWSKYCGKMAS